MGMELSTEDRKILERLFTWHVAPWTEAFSAILPHIGDKPRRVLEIGATGRSAPSMFFLLKGASVEVTCYMEEEMTRLKRYCEGFCREHKLPLPSMRSYDIFAGADKDYDIIFMKGVLGGVNHEHDLKAFARAVNTCLAMLKPGGHLIVMDKGWCSSLHNLMLRGFGAGGKHNWHYFSHSELETLTDRCLPPVVVWRGYLSLGVMPFRWMQNLADVLDRRLFNRRLLRRGAVFAAVFSKRPVEKPALVDSEKTQMEP
jgi:hypothetical protein